MGLDMQMTLIETAHRSREFVAAYDHLAPAYDAFTGFGDYAAWVRGLLREVAEAGVCDGRALEVGCGTGRTTVALLEAGFAVEACDPSAAMLRLASARLGDDAHLQLGGLPQLPPGPLADLVVALNDVVNYIAHDELRPAVAALARRTAPGGVVLFDVNTLSVYERGFFASTWIRRADGHLFVWEPLGSDVAGAFDADLHVVTPDRPDAGGRAACTHVVSSHRHFHHAHAAVLEALRDAGLEPLATLGQHDDGGRDPHFDEALHTKRMYLARRP